MKHIWKQLVVLCLLLLMLAASACSAGDMASVEDLLGQMLNRDVTGEIGKEYRTEWFSFCVESCEQVKAYAGYQPAEGYVLYDVVMRETNTFDTPIGMGIFDFFMDHVTFAEYAYPLDPHDSSMMPLEFELGLGETATYHVLFEIPADVQEGLELIYMEIDSEEQVYATYTIPIDCDTSIQSLPAGSRLAHKGA